MTCIEWLHAMFAMFAHIAGRVFDVLSRSVLELFLGIFHAIPVNAMRNNVPPSVWWTVYRYILVIASVLLSLRLLVTVELDEETQKVFGDVYHFLTENTRLLTYASVALKSSTLLMTIFLSTKKGKAALQLLIPTLTRHREAPSRQGRFVEYALKASILFVIGWYVVIIWVYRAKFDHEKHPVAAGVWGTAAGVWITDIFLGLATLCALHFVIVDELDREAAAALEEARDLLAPLPNNLMIVPPMVNGQLVVDHFLRVIRSNAQLNGFEGYFMSSLYTLFVTISIVLYEIFFGVPSHGFIRAMLVASLVFEGAVFFFPNWVADSLNETKVAAFKEMLIEIQHQNRMQPVVDNRLDADVCRALQMLEMSMGVRVLNVLAINKLTIFGFMWSIVMFFFLVKAEIK